MIMPGLERCDACHEDRLPAVILCSSCADVGDKITRERNEARAENVRLRKALEEREADMHMRIRLGYDKTVADCWRAENERLRVALRAAADALADIHTHEESYHRGTAYSGDRANAAEHAARAALSEGDADG